MKRSLTLHKKEKHKFCCQRELNWENTLVNSIGKGLFTNLNKALVNALNIYILYLYLNTFGKTF